MQLQLPNVTLIAIDCINYERVKSAVEFSRRNIDFGCVKILTHFDISDPLIEKIKPINSIQEYSDFMIKDLNKHFSTDFVLVVQWDGIVLNTKLWSNEFLMYDYIGAPWTAGMLKSGIPKKFNVGNGGFSIRSKRLQDRLSIDDNLIYHEAEDVMICQLNRNYLEQLGFTFAPYEIASQFSWETGPEHLSFGSHGRHHVLAY